MFKNFTKCGINHIFSRDTAIINEEPKNDNCLDVKVFSSEMNDQIYDKIKIEDEFTNNSLQRENIARTIQNYEDNYFDDKVLVCETTINKSYFGSKDYIEDDQVKQCEIFALNNIDMKFSQPQEYHNKVKVENQIIAPNNIKIEFYNEELFCHQCNESYQLYCTKCQMLVHILNRSTITMHKKAEDDVPNNILEIRETLGYFGIFALTVIPRGVKFGPFTGLSVSKCTWKLKGGKLVVDDNESKFPCWMQYINFARSISDQNLLVFQYENDLYYRSTREILEGEELLVYFGDEYENLYNNVEMNFTLAPEKNMEDVFACTFCCLGFNAKEYLIKHKSICLNGINENYSIKEIMQCPFCKIHLDQQEYLEHHRNYCLNKTSS